jgi:hypothetical protein
MNQNPKFEVRNSKQIQDSDSKLQGSRTSPFEHLTLHGRVSNPYVPQIAQELVKNLKGVEIIDNQIKHSNEAIACSN